MRPTTSASSGRPCSTPAGLSSAWVGTSRPILICTLGSWRRTRRRVSTSCSSISHDDVRQLRCYILTWDYGALYTLERDPLTRWRLGWRMPRGIRLGFDDHHPVGGSHHQKVVVVDDQLAFCGGIDLTAHRWDTSAHRPEEPARVTPLGAAYGPYHEVHAMVTGPAAASLGELARDRWHALGTKPLPPVATSSEDLWPSEITPDLTDVDVAIARTMPESGSTPAIRECEALFLDSIALAKRTIYIESQYFTNDRLADALAARLREPDGPEVIVVSPKECHGWLEQTTMGAFRGGAFERLIAADEHKRLRLVYPAASQSRDVPTFVHSKVMIADDVLARIGSANFSNRSMGMDTECDVAVDAIGNPDAQAGIRRIRDRLLAEHLGLSADAVADGVERHGSIRAFVDTRTSADHTLVPIDTSEQAEPPSELLRGVADPGEPAAFSSSVASLVPAAYATSEPLRIWILPAVVLAAATAVAWRSSHTLDSIASAPSALWIGIVVLVVGALLLVPLELLAIVAGVYLGALQGGVVALIGSLVAAVIGYVAGRAIGNGGAPALDQPAITSIRPATGRQRRRRYRDAASRQRGQRRVDSSDVRCGTRPVCDVSCRHDGRPRPCGRCAHWIGRPASARASESIGVQRSDDHRRIRDRVRVRIGIANVSSAASIRASNLQPSRRGGVRLVTLPPPIKVATYNVHACVGRDGRQDPDRVATVIAELDADVVALQEFTYPASVALETRTPVVLTTLDRYECALGPTRQRARQQKQNASATRCSRVIPSWRSIASTCRWSAAKHEGRWRRRLMSGARCCTCSRHTLAFASTNADFKCGRSWTISIR